MRIQPNAPRRENVERGIYRRRAATGITYEITYTDSTGVQRWQTIAGGLREARQARAEITSKLGRGERIAPTRQTLAELAETCLAGADLRESTKVTYETVLRCHVYPRLGRRRIASITEDDVAALISTMREAGYSPYTIKGVLTPLSRVLNHAVRRGLIPSNPITRLERSERPKMQRREMRVLDSGEIARLLDAAEGVYLPLLAASIFTGLRQGEALGLTFADVDLDAGLVRVRKQLDRQGRRIDPKTAEAVRDVVLMPALGRMLRAQKEEAFARGFAKPSDFVFSSALGTPLHYRNVSRRGLERAMQRAGLDGEGRPRLRWHDLRHTYASLLIAQGANVVFVSRQLGHASSSITLDVYSHLFDRAEHAERASAALEAGFGALLGLEG